MFSPARIAVLLTPIIAGLSGWLCTLIARYFPGAPDLDETQITAVMVAGLIAGFGIMAQWLRGRAKWEENQALLEIHQGSAPDHFEEFDETTTGKPAK